MCEWLGKACGGGGGGGGWGGCRLVCPRWLGEGYEVVNWPSKCAGLPAHGTSQATRPLRAVHAVSHPPHSSRSIGCKSHHPTPLHSLPLPLPCSKQNPVANLGLGGLAGTVAATVCYPLDTIRRRMQMRGVLYRSQADAFVTIWRTEGARGFYRGWAANTLKVVPQNAIRFVSYEALKAMLGVAKRKTDT
jgi:hypothetical protein